LYYPFNKELGDQCTVVFVYYLNQLENVPVPPDEHTHTQAMQLTNYAKTTFNWSPSSSLNCEIQHYNFESRILSL
jgi:hypothetical protein